MRILLWLVLALLALAPAAHARVAAQGVPPRLQIPPPPGPDPATASGAITLAWLDGHIGRIQRDSWRDALKAAGNALERLDGQRAAELAGALAGVQRLAAAGRLTVSRMPLAFLTVSRNVTQWSERPVPAAGGRVTFGRDPSIWQYFPGQGIQFHPLATAGRANALAEPGERERPRGCRRGALGIVLSRLVATASRRDGFLAWEYRFDYGGGTAPWVSAMAQATAAQALARGAELLGDREYRYAALRALGAFETPPPAGVALRTGRGREYLMYSFNPGLHIINGFLQSLIGLHDVAELTGSERARRLFVLGERTARDTVADYDTGAWSRYSLGGSESTLEYHQLVRGFAQDLCERMRDAVYCDAAARLTRYETEPPRIRISTPARGREDRAAGFDFSISKVSDVTVRVRDRHGTVQSAVLSLPRGTYPVAWTPPRGGAFTIRVTATGPEGLTGSASEPVAVRHTRVPCRSTSPRRPRGCTPRSKRSTRTRSKR